MKSRAVILGQGGHAKVIESLIYKEYKGISQRKFTIKKTVMIIEDGKEIPCKEYANCDFYIGIGDNYLRKKAFDILKNEDITIGNCISQDAFIAKTAKIGEGVFIAPKAAIMANSRIGNNVIINTSSSVDHACFIGNDSQITAGVTIGGEVSIGEKCFLGIKSAIIPRVKIGDNSAIMAGSVVTKDVPENVVIGGNPATVIKRST